jgi:hypothetical protein
MLWWIRFLFFSAVAIFFLEFGIEEMVRAYNVRNPVDFLGSFFAASFIIVISGTLLTAFIWRMILRWKDRKAGEETGSPDGQNE